MPAHYPASLQSLSDAVADDVADCDELFYKSFKYQE